MSTDVMNGERTDATLQALRERYASMETYGVDMKNFKYWLPGREEDYLVHKTAITKLTRNLVRLNSEYAELSRLRQCVKNITEAISSLSTINAEGIDLDSLLRWTRGGASLLSKCDKKIEESSLENRQFIARYRSALMTARIFYEFHLHFLICHKLFYIFCHAADRFRNKLLRESLREFKCAYTLHEQMINSNEKHRATDQGDSGTGPNDVFIQELNRMHNILRAVKVAANTVASVSAVAAEKIKNDVAHMIANEIETYEKPENMKRLDSILAKTPPREKRRYDFVKEDYLIMSGGQTGVDRAALDAARKMGFRYGGWLPKGRKTEDGVLSPEYGGMKEMPTDDYLARTEQNVIDSDMTVVICHGEPEGGTRRTIGFCEKHKRPYHVLNPNNLTREVMDSFFDFLEKTAGTRINFAGPRASKQPAIYDEAESLIEEILGYLES